jgi:multimeric flavodoxin WrbA
MAMKIAAIIGSPHGLKGNTAMVLQQVTLAAQKAGAAVVTLSLDDHEVAPCRGCDACHKSGVCQGSDDFGVFKAAIYDADGIVLASPNYIASVSAQMKALFDRFCGPLHMQDLRGKYAAAVVTSGAPGASAEVEAYMLRFLRNLGCWTVGSVGASVGEVFQEGAPWQQAAGVLGQKLCSAIAAKSAFSDQVKEREAFYERMKALVSARRQEWPHEYQSWKARGWL